MHPAWLFNVVSYLRTHGDDRSRSECFRGTAVGDQMVGVGESRQKASCDGIIAGAPFRQQQAHRLARTVTHSVSL